jgi:hypothetical protein
VPTPQGINYKTDANGLPDALDIMKSTKPTKFEKQHATAVCVSLSYVVHVLAFRNHSIRKCLVQI